MGGGRKTWERLARGESGGLGGRLASVGLWGLSALYGGALQVHHAGYRLGLARRTRLPALVISIGNLTVGGTGKTTATIGVARWLTARGKRVAILSRGYRGSGERGTAVVSEGDGPLVDMRAAGDEPYMMARALPGVSVLVGKDRRRTGRRAVEDLGAEVLVLDDGFQYQRLEKDIEIVLVDALAPFGYDFLVPRGLLREPPRHLARADAVWVTHSDLVCERDLEAVRARVKELAPGARVWEARHAPIRLRSLAGEERELAPEELRGRRVLALSSVGNPAAFERTLEQMGAVLVGRARFPDHHGYTEGDLLGLTEGDGAAAEWVVTTEKDAVRLPVRLSVRLPMRLPAGEIGRAVWVLEVELAGRNGGVGMAEELAWLLEARGKI